MADMSQRTRDGADGSVDLQHLPGRDAGQDDIENVSDSEQRDDGGVGAVERCILNDVAGIGASTSTASSTATATATAPG